ncbi:MAG: dihydrofolate reductase [Blastocatellia bacterium]
MKGTSGLLISLIVAMDEQRGIGRDNGLPWRLPADLKRFRELTMGHHLIAGRKTWESIGRPLPGRQMIVVTRNPRYQAPECLMAHSLNEAIALAAARGETEAFIIGGADIYTQTLGMAHRLYLTQVHATVSADTFFPMLDEHEWRETAALFHAADEKNPYPFTFRTLERKAA